MYVYMSPLSDAGLITLFSQFAISGYMKEVKSSGDRVASHLKSDSWSVYVCGGVGGCQSCLNCDSSFTSNSS